jgi:hypothetical protein
MESWMIIQKPPIGGESFFSLNWLGQWFRRDAIDSLLCENFALLKCLNAMRMVFNFPIGIGEVLD